LKSSAALILRGQSSSGIINVMAGCGSSMPLRLVAGVKQALGFGLVSGSQTGLLAGGGVFGVEYARAPEQVESRFHNVFV